MFSICFVSFFTPSHQIYSFTINRIIVTSVLLLLLLLVLLLLLLLSSVFVCGYSLSPQHLAGVMQAGLATRWWQESCCKLHVGSSHMRATSALTSSPRCAQSNRWCMMRTLDRQLLWPNPLEAQRLMEWTLCSWLTRPPMMLQQLWVSIFALKVTRRDVANLGSFCCPCMQPVASSLCCAWTAKSTTACPSNSTGTKIWRCLSVHAVCCSAGGAGLDTCIDWQSATLQ